MRRFNGSRGLSIDNFTRLCQNLLLVTLNRREPTPFHRDRFIGRREGQPSDHYEVEGSLGEGVFGTVHKIVCKETAAVRVMKSISKQKAACSGMPPSMVMEEIDSLKALDHPAILRLFEYFVDAEALHLVTDLLPGGTLLEATVNGLKEGNPVSELWVAQVMHQVCEGIAYAHDKGVMHKDLKLDNVMLCAAQPPHAVVIDVGFAELFPPEQSETFHSRSVGGTLPTMAPEVIMQSFTCKCDVWSLGCCLYGLMCIRPTAFRTPNGSLEVVPYPWPPPEGRTPQEVNGFLQEQRRGPNWENFRGGPDAVALLRAMLCFDERPRPSMAQVLQHPWFAGVAASRGRALSGEELQSLVNFERATRFEEAVLVDIASQLPLLELKEFASLFESLDRDGSGTLDAKELAEAMCQAGMEQKLAMDAAERLAIEGPVEFSRFVAALVPSQRKLLAAKLRLAFNRMDTDRDGFLRSSEVSSMLSAGQAPEGQGGSRALLALRPPLQIQTSLATENVFNALGATPSPSGCQKLTFEKFSRYFKAMADATPTDVGTPCFFHSRCEPTEIVLVEDPDSPGGGDGEEEGADAADLTG